MPAWDPTMPWPSGTPGGASSPNWGGYVRLWARAALVAGYAFHMGPHDRDRLDAGNVMGGAPTLAVSAPTPPDRLWIDMSCDVLDVDITGGASSSEGILTQPDATTCVVTLADPTRRYDPLNGDSPYALGGRSRLVPGTPIEVFAEVVNGDDGSWSRHWLFTGTADSWGEDWTPRPSNREAKLVATGESKAFVNMKRPELDPPVGAGETTEQRIDRIVADSGWLGDVEPGVSTVTLSATKMDQSGIELLQRTINDELGFVYFTGEGTLRWVGRHTWFELPDPVLGLGCLPELHDVLVDASPSAIDAQIRNSIFAVRTDGVEQAAISNASISRFGRFDYSASDLGVQTDAQAAAWAQTLLMLYAFPQISLSDVTMRPGIDPRSWEVWQSIFAVQYVTDLVRIYWVPPDQPDATPIDTLSRVVGVQHSITRAAWEMKVELVDAEALAYSGAVFTMGPHANDRLDSAFVMG